MEYKRGVIVDIMRSWVGKKESDNSHRVIIDIYNTISPLPRGYKMKYSDAWCAACVSAAFQMAGYISLFSAECSCYRMVQDAQKMNIWVEADDYIPKPGDVILYDWQDNGVGDNKGTADHVGVVETVNDGKITVIEGNYSDSVKRRTLNVNGKYIRGFITPKYTKEPTPQPTPKFKEGDIVEFTGTTHYTNANATTGKTCKGGKAFISQIYQFGKSKHPYHLVAIKDGGSTVYGWVDEQYIKTTQPPEEVIPEISETPEVTEVRASQHAQKSDSKLAGTYKTTTDLNLRDGAGTSYKSLVVLPKNTVVKNYGYYNLVGNTKWLSIQVTLNGIKYTGFSSSNYLKKQ